MSLIKCYCLGGCKKEVNMLLDSLHLKNDGRWRAKGCCEHCSKSCTTIISKSTAKSIMDSESIDYSGCDKNMVDDIMN
jgi:hypothetical protein